MNGKLEVKFEEGWAEYYADSKEFEKTLHDANERLSKSKAPSKGVGKGKAKGHNK